MIKHYFFLLILLTNRNAVCYSECDANILAYLLRADFVAWFLAIFVETALQNESGSVLNFIFF